MPAALRGLVDQAGAGDQLGQHHRHRLQRLDLDLVIAARCLVLDGEHADRLLAPHDRHAGEAVVEFLAGLGPVGEIGVAGRLVEVQRLDLLGDLADEPLAERELGDVDRFLPQPARGEEFEHAVAQQVDRADLAVHRLADDLHDLVELGLRIGARGHHVVEAGEDLAGGGGGRSAGRVWGMRPGLSERRRGFPMPPAA